MASIIMLVIASKTNMCIASGVGLGSGITGRDFGVGYEFARPVAEVEESYPFGLACALL